MTFLPKYIASVFFILAAAPAISQQACGTVGANGQWIGGSESASDISTTGTYQEQMALVLGSNQFIALFKTSAETDVRVEAAGRGAADPLIELYDSTGNIVLSDDDSGGNGAARGEITLAAGNYCLAVKSFDAAAMTSIVRIGRTDQEALTEGAATIEPPVSDIPVDGLACVLNDSMVRVDFDSPSAGSVSERPNVRFTLPSAQPVTIIAENETADPLITLYDASGTYLSENDDFDGLNSRLDMTTPLPAGDYCLSIQALSDATVPVTLTLQIYDPAAAMIGMFDRGEASPPLDGSYPVTDLGALQNRLLQDVQGGSKSAWFKFDIADAGLVILEAISTGGTGDPSLMLFDDLGRSVAQNDDNGSSLDSLIAVKVLPGTYLVALRGGEGNFTRLLLERYVPAE